MGATAACLKLHAQIGVGHRLNEDLVNFGILKFAQLGQLADAHVRIRIFEAQLYVLDDLEGGLLCGVTAEVADAGADLTLVRQSIAAECATEALATVLR